MHLSIMEYFEDMLELFKDEKIEEIQEIFESIEFKLNKNSYHFDNIKRLISPENMLDKSDFYKEVHLPIYYETESFLVSLRSSVDILLHLVNNSFELGIKSNEVYLNTVYHHRNLPKTVKNTFERYTRPFNNPIWNFIYSSRNEIVHERSVQQVLPIDIDLFSSEIPIVFFEYENNQKEMISFFNQCLKFLETFASQLFQAIKISL